MEISVIIPVYNNGSTLEACVASVTRQAFQPLEILLVDDGSPEGTAEAEKLEREESRVRLLRHEHGGGDLERKPHEFFFAADVRNRFSRCAPLHEFPVF